MSEKPTIRGRTAVAYAHALRLRDELGRWPYCRELAESLRLSGRGPAAHHLRRLAAAGLVPLRPRGAPLRPSADSTPAEQRALDVADALREVDGKVPSGVEVAEVLGISRERARQLLLGREYRQHHADQERERRARMAASGARP